MTDLKPPELFSQRPAHMEFVHEQFTRGEIARMRSYRIRRIVTCVVLGGLIGVAIYAAFFMNRKPAEIPTIQAEGALKQKPDQPGGLDVPNQDVLAYQQIDNSGTKPEAEHLLPPPETPQPAAAASATAQPAPTFPSAPKVENFEAPSVDALAPAPVTQQPPVESTPASSAPPPAVPLSREPPAPATTRTVEVTPSPSASSSAPVAAASPTPEESDDNAPAPAQNEKAPVKVAAGKRFRIQLASFPDEEEAGHEMGLMQKRYASQLGVAKLHLAKADLGARGIFYRLQSNPLSEGDARSICAALKKLNTGCIIVKP